MKHITIAAFVLFALVMPAITKAQDTVACTMQYQPVCGTEKGTYKTYGNGCTLGAEGAVYQHEGECSAAELKGTQAGPYMPPAHCTAWNDGCNSCARGTNGQAACTLMACMELHAGYCTAYGDTETGTEPAPAPGGSVSSGMDPGVTAATPVPPIVATATASTTATEEYGFFARIWTSITAWFGNLF